MTEWPLGSADVYFQIGIAYTELVNHSCALEAFNNAIKINPEYAEVSFFRDMLNLVHSVAVTVCEGNRNKNIEWHIKSFGIRVAQYFIEKQTNILWILALRTDFCFMRYVGLKPIIKLTC